MVVRVSKLSGPISWAIAQCEWSADNGKQVRDASSREESSEILDNTTLEEGSI